MEPNQRDADPLFFTCNLCPKIFTTKEWIDKHLYAHAVLKTQALRQTKILELLARGQPSIMLDDICKAKAIRKEPKLLDKKICIRLVRINNSKIWRCICKTATCAMKSPLQLVDGNRDRKHHLENRRNGCCGGNMWSNKKGDSNYVPTDSRKQIRTVDDVEDHTPRSSARPKRSCAEGKVPNYVEEDEQPQPKKPRCVNKPKPEVPVGLRNLCLWCNKAFKTSAKRIEHEDAVHCPPKTQSPQFKSLSGNGRELKFLRFSIPIVLKSLGLDMKCTANTVTI